MSMILIMAALSDPSIERVVKEPALAMRIVFPDEADDEELGVGASSGSAGVGVLELRPGEGELADLDKAWHGIHYLLTGTVWDGDPPLNALVLGGRELRDEDGDWGYGAPRVLTSSESAAFGRALAALSDDELAARFDPADMMEREIYPEIWDRDREEEDTLGYLMEHVTVLRDFVRAAVEQRFGLLIALT